MDMCYDGALVMPSSYAVMDEEEMTYVEGGGVPRWTAAAIIDAALLATPLGAAFAPFKYLGRAAGKALVKKYAGQIVGKMGWLLSKLGGAVGSATVNFTVGRFLGIFDAVVSCGTSIGGCISLILDASDSSGLNSWIGQKGFRNFKW
ncbi:MAG: hypothetical protein PUC12_03795 [Clostridiales bacterium]|nr:hypothetical protein [Clostridiales bacterium]